MKQKIMLGEKSQTQESTFYVIPFIMKFKTSKTNLWCSKLEALVASVEGGMDWLERYTREPSGEKEIGWWLHGVHFVKTHPVVHFKFYFIVCKLFLDLEKIC